MNPVRSFKKAVLRLEIISGLLTARILIRFVPFRFWRHTLGPIDEIDHPSPAELSPREMKMASDIGRLIKRLARKQKFNAVCFPQAMAARWILNRRNIASRMVLGSRKDAKTGLAMHAWLKVGDQVITGQDEYEQFRSFKRGSSKAQS